MPPIFMAKNKASKKSGQTQAASGCFHAGFLIHRPCRRRRHIPPKRRLIFNGLHGVISQKTEPFITTAVRASDPVYCTVMLAIHWAIYSCNFPFTWGRNFLCSSLKYCHVLMAPWLITTDFGWLDLLTPPLQSLLITINDCLRLAPFWLDCDCLLF
jgi:hypothetical protein